MIQSACKGLRNEGETGINPNFEGWRTRSSDSLTLKGRKRQKLAPILGTYHEKNKQIKKYQIKIGACRDLKRMMGRA